MTIQLIKNTDVNGEISFNIIDESNNVLSPVYGFQPDAEKAFAKMQSNLVRWGNPTNSEVISEFIFTPES